jgi:hypothetical protein
MPTPRAPGSFRLSHPATHRAARRGEEAFSLFGGARAQRIIASIQADIGEGGRARVRQILASPRELYRIELERPDMSYLRITVLDRDALESLLEVTPEPVLRERFSFPSPLPD